MVTVTVTGVQGQDTALGGLCCNVRKHGVTLWIEIERQDTTESVGGVGTGRYYLSCTDCWKFTVVDWGTRRRPPHPPHPRPHGIGIATLSARRRRGYDTTISPKISEIRLVNLGEPMAEWSKTLDFESELKIARVRILSVTVAQFISNIDLVLYRLSL
ncbi:hypothetical protein J6590_062828 [Homalodisca vitripennis]|nr:hypothetical protein J6590_062828 [Homalodisca vitripennis]